MGCAMDCPNIRYEQTKKGGFLGIGSEGYYYCSCNNAKLNDSFMKTVCRGRRDYRQGDDMQYVDPYNMKYNEGRYATSGFIDCNQYKIHKFKN